MIPGDMVRNGTEFVVEFDGDDLPLAERSQIRFPPTGRYALHVEPMPELNLMWVPIHYASELHKGLNPAVDEWIRNESGTALEFPSALLPIGDVRTSVRDPYVTWADTMESGGYGLLYELELVRHVEQGHAPVYYHGMFAYPQANGHPDSWFAGVAERRGFTALSEYTRLPIAHELGHNFGLLHAPCGTSASLDPEYPYADGEIGVWGWGWNGNPATGHRLLPPHTKDVMTYCGGLGISDYHFRKALAHRVRLQQAAYALAPQTESTVLLWGGMDGRRLRLWPAFVWEAAIKLPEGSGRYRLDGLSDDGTRLFSLSFDPDPVDHGGAGFLFAIPFDPSWRDALDRITLSGPEGTVTVDRSAGERAAIVTGASGRIRSIVPDFPTGAAAAAFLSDGAGIVRGLPARRRR